MDPELYNAAITGCSDFSEKISEADSNIYLGQVTAQSNTVLHVAAKSGQRKLAEAVLISDASLLHATNAKGNTALHVAARLGHADMARVLSNKAKELEPELEANLCLLRAVNMAGDTALHEALKGGHCEVAALLLDEDRELPCFVNGAGESPLFVAVDRGFFRAALLMIETSPKCSLAGRNGMNALHAAVIRAHKCNQFMSSCSSKHSLMIRDKLSHITRIVFPSFNLLLSTFKIPITGSDFVGKVLKKCPSSMVEADDFGWIPLHYAAHLGSLEAVELFLEINHSSVVYIKDKEGLSALHIAAREGRVEVMRLIVAKCPDTCELLDDKDRTALHVGVENGKSNAVKSLLRMPAFQDLINEQDRAGDTALHRAAFNGDPKILEMLAKDPRVDKGAVNGMGMTAVDILRSSNGNQELEIVKTLSIATLQMRGALPSLEQKITREPAESHRVYVKYDEEFREPDMGKHVDGASYGSPNTNRKSEPEASPTTTMSLDLKNTPAVNLLVSTIIATITFAAAFAMPGGFDERGLAVSGKKRDFKMFLLFDSLAFGCSAASMFVHFLVAAWPKRLFLTYPIHCVTALTEFSVLALALAFVHGVLSALPASSGVADVATNSVLLSFSVPLLYFAVKIVYHGYHLFKGLNPSSKKYY